MTSYPRKQQKFRPTKTAKITSLENLYVYSSQNGEKIIPFNIYVCFGILPLAYTILKIPLDGHKYGMLMILPSLLIIYMYDLLCYMIWDEVCG